MGVGLYGALGALLLAGLVVPALAHTTVHVEQYEIEAGWGTEPPVVGIRNNIVLKVIERGETEGTFTGITNVFRGVEAVAHFGGASKQLDISSDPRPGYYFSPIIPTRTGTYQVELRGELHGVAVDVKIPVEDVEPTAILDFPPSGSAGDADVAALKNAVSSLQRDVARMESGGISVESGGAAYDIALTGLAIAGAAIVLAVVSMTKRK